MDMMILIKVYLPRFSLYILYLNFRIHVYIYIYLCFLIFLIISYVFIKLYTVCVCFPMFCSSSLNTSCMRRLECGDHGVPGAPVRLDESHFDGHMF